MVEDDDVIEMILMPVIVETASATTGATSVTAIKPLTQLAATTIRSGKNEYSPMRIKILYNGF